MDGVQPFMTAFTGQAIRCTLNAPETDVRLEYSVLPRLVMNQEQFKGLKAEELTSIRDKVAELKIIMVETYQDQCGEGLYTLMFHLFNHPTEALKGLGA